AAHPLEIVGIVRELAIDRIRAAAGRAQEAEAEALPVERMDASERLEAAPPHALAALRGRGGAETEGVGRRPLRRHFAPDPLPPVEGLAEQRAALLQREDSGDRDVRAAQALHDARLPREVVLREDLEVRRHQSHDQLRALPYVAVAPRRLDE